MKPGIRRSNIVAAVALVAAMVFLTCNKNSSSNEADDGNSPYTVIDLAVDTVTPTTVKLIWTATGDDSDQGTASSYDIRYRSICPNGDFWDSATQVAGEPHPSPAGQKDSMTITGLTEDSTYYFALRIYDEAGNFGGSVCAVGTCFNDYVVTFADPNLLTAVRAFISRPTGDIYRSYLMPYTGFFGNASEITSLSGMEHWSSLVSLGLAGNHVTDLTPISGLARLEGLDATGNGVANLAPIAGLTKLQVLHLRADSVSNIAALAGLTDLREVDLTQNQITDLAPLVSNSGFATNDTLRIGENPLSTDAINVQIPALQARGVTVLGL
ncbi:hypothetical protein C3F09_09185 [candidate division GN15 bacterium]|uniref:Fibronectin type-III domain-containing protein n=1 Tax=candidate division GN15 bacterium TaxID=2072418 RepID=A0A855WY20_9BACT|nr:MAG: hypothetical protein C3F09_09185 [candidate division GN15 bacterium]